MCTDTHEMASMAKNFYENLYASKSTIGMEEVLSHIPVKVDGHMNSRLNSPYSKEEVKTTYCFKCFP